MRLFWLTLLAAVTLAVDGFLFLIWVAAGLTEDCPPRGEPGGGLACEDWLEHAGAEIAALIVVLTTGAVFMGLRIWRKASDTGEA